MKTLMRFSIASIYFFLTLSSLSCDLSSSEDKPNDIYYYEDWEINTLHEANYELTNNTWKTTYINVGTVNPELLNYKFIFNTNKTLIATYGTSSYSGTWSVTDDNPNQNIISDLKLNLVFSSPTIFTKMSQKWTFNSHTSNLFNDNQGEQIEFVYITNGITTASFGLQEIK